MEDGKATLLASLGVVPHMVGHGKAPISIEGTSILLRVTLLLLPTIAQHMKINGQQILNTFFVIEGKKCLQIDKYH